MKKKLTVILAIFLSGLLLLLSGCGAKIYEDEDFYYSIYPVHPKPGEKRYIELKGLTETGKSKSIIIVPKEIDGLEVHVLTDSGRWTRVDSRLKSENLEAIYIQNSLCIMNSGTFYRCPNLKKIIFLDSRTLPDMYDLPDTYDIGIGGPPDLYYYTSSYGLDEYIPKLYSEEELSEGLYFNPTSIGGHWKLANVSYMQNYEGAENKGYYWIDNFEYGTTIDYIPENPLREGYVFGGWFKEPEGINIWNFENDKLPELVLNEKGEELYQETRLYAKWYKK